MKKFILVFIFFFLCLSFSIGQAEETPAPRVLIVKYHSEIAKEIAHSLSNRYGYVTATTDNVESALSIWEDFRPDIVMTGKMLPKRVFARRDMNGGRILLQKAPKDKAKVVDFGVFAGLPDSLVDAVVPKELVKVEEIVNVIEALLSDQNPPKRTSYRTFGQKCMAIFNIFKN